MRPAAENGLDVALVQMRMGEDPEENTDRAEEAVRQAAAGGARLVCLPELFRSRYFCQSEDERFFELAEAVPGATTERFAGVARELDVAIVLSLFERRAPGIFHNTAAVVDGQHGYLGKYRKMHIPDDPRYYEKYYFTPGDTGFGVFTTGGRRLGVLVCWDQWYPEAARLTALKGAELLIYPTAIGWHPEEKAMRGEAQQQAWETIQRSHAIANGCFVLAINRVGHEPDPAGGGGIEFWGNSFICGPDGQVLARAGSGEPEIIHARLELDSIEAQRVGWPFFRDRRIDAYDGLSARFLDEV
jgi:N-carbamoylputrescine amidase